MFFKDFSFCLSGKLYHFVTSYFFSFVPSSITFLKCITHC